MTETEYDSEMNALMVEGKKLQNDLLRRQIEIRDLGIKWFKMAVEMLLVVGAKKQGVKEEELGMYLSKMKEDGLL